MDRNGGCANYFIYEVHLDTSPCCHAVALVKLHVDPVGKKIFSHGTASAAPRAPRSVSL
jgi:hypothetical protein